MKIITLEGALYSVLSKIQTNNYSSKIVRDEIELSM